MTLNRGRQLEGRRFAETLLRPNKSWPRSLSTCVVPIPLQFLGLDFKVSKPLDYCLASIQNPSADANVWWPIAIQRPPIQATNAPVKLCRKICFRQILTEYVA